ncbi:MAG: aminotransferase class I/II-fold pyridoxal phosphate-dependent enzyme [Gemmatimonadales bacterium]|nr:aminotransferase class I/II-fold pyridoxal phosphate-dependent enzyme [Gemmatimonadales bacterium]
MQPEEFRHRAHALVDWMADYLRDVGSLPVTPAVHPGEIRDRLPVAAPDRGEPFPRIFDDFRHLILPGMTHWNHPGWFGYFPANNSPPSILAEMLTATLGAQCMSWATSPAATELEQTTMAWLAGMLRLPPGFTGVIQDTASTATLTALLSARECAAEGTRTVYASEEAHSSVDKGVKLAGYGLEQLRRIPTDTNFAMNPAALDRQLTDDRRAGLVPACVVATVGTTSSTAIDPLPAIGEICRRHGVWLHVDAAYAGTAAIVPELRAMLDGVEHADSFVFNPHKWMLVNFDCTAYFVRDVPALLRTFQITPEYLRTSADDGAVNFRDWGIPLGRRFRALKLWFVIRSYGLEGLREMVRRHVALGTAFAGWVEADPEFELLAPAPLGLVVFRHRPAGMTDAAALDAHNAALLARVNATRRVHLTHTRLGGRYAIRLAVGQRCTGAAEVALAWDIVREARNQVVAGS